MPSIISTIGYITESNTIPSVNSSNTTVTKGIIVCKRPENNNPLFINFVAFNSTERRDHQLMIEAESVYLLYGKFVYNSVKNYNGENYEGLQFNVMSAYKIDIRISKTPQQEVFVSFQCNVLSAPVISNENISFKSQTVEFNGRTRTEIPITCICSIDDKRMLNKINRLQKGNRVEIVGNLINNDKEEIVVLVTYLVYFNANNFATSNKKDLSKLPWLNPTKKSTTNEDQSQDSNDDESPEFITDQHKKTFDSEVQDVNNDDEIIEIDDSEDALTNKPQNLMKYKTNLPSVLRLQVGCRVMFLNNKHIKKQIANGTIGVVVDIDKIREIIRVAFCISGGMVDIEVGPEPAHFFINGRPACRIQYPLQNAFALTAHKTQSITLPQASLYLDNQMFAPGQSYVVISRCQSWDDIQILSLSPDAFLVDQRVKEEYARLEQISYQNLPI